jgi:hypothetical protein
MGETPACRATSAIVTLERGRELLRTGWSFSVDRFKYLSQDNPHCLKFVLKKVIAKQIW